MNKHIINGAAAVILAFTFSGCHIYNKYELPADNAIVGDYSKAAAASQDPDLLGNLGWQQVFTDPVLQGYINIALEKNIDLENARLNVEAANAQLKGAKLSYFPALAFAPNGGSASYGGSHMNWSYTLPLQASWEIDAFGKILNRKRGAEASKDMAEAYVKATQSQIIAGVAKCYYTLVMLNRQYDLLKRTSVIWTDQVRSMKLMKEAGWTNEAAVVQSEANLYSVLSQMPDIENSIHQTQNSLSLLLCSYPQEWGVAADADFKLPTMVCEGVPMSYLAVRPDVAAAEKNFASAYYATNQARSNFYPSIVISAQGGFTNLLGSLITNPGKWFISLAGSLTAPIFSRGQNIATLQAAKAQQQIALNNFQQTVLNAASEVSDALVEIRTNSEKNEQLAKQIDALEKSVDYTQTLFTTSNATYLELLTARSQLLSAQINSLNCWYARVNALIYLYQSVGGGR